MSFTDSNYCSLSRYLLKCIGQWPAQSFGDRAFRTTFIVALVAIAVLTQIIKLITSLHDLDELTATIPPLLTTLVTCTKFLTLVINNGKIRHLQSKMNVVWKTITVKKEMEIMEQYLSEAKLVVTAYAIYMYVTIITFILLIFEPRVLDMVSPLNEPRPLKTIFPADYYFITVEEHFVTILCHMIVSCMVVVTILIAADTMLMMYIQFVCGMLKIVGYRLEYTLYKYDDKEFMSSEERRKQYDTYIVQCVSTHRKTLELMELIQSTYSLSKFIQLGLNVVNMSVTFVQVVVLLGKLEVIRYILYAFGQLFHIFVTTYQGQQLIDHSLGISDKLYSGVWYNAPVRTQKMLLFILKRFAIPCYLSAGKIFVFSLVNFTMVVQNCMSYFMVLVSFR